MSVQLTLCVFLVHCCHTSFLRSCWCIPLQTPLAIPLHSPENPEPTWPLLAVSSCHPPFSLPEKRLQLPEPAAALLLNHWRGRTPPGLGTAVTCWAVTMGHACMMHAHLCLCVRCGLHHVHPDCFVLSPSSPPSPGSCLASLGCPGSPLVQPL